MVESRRGLLGVGGTKYWKDMMLEKFTWYCVHLTTKTGVQKSYM